MTDNIPDEKALLASYEALEELRKLQDEIINMDWTHVEKDGKDSESILFQRFGVMLDTYQEQAYLLDPYLESLVGPVVDRIKDFAKASLANPDLVYNAWRVHLISSVLYSYVKFRGYKTIIRFFPHEIADLTIALDFMNLEGGLPKHPHLWSMRYVTLLWLYIICIIPFDFAQFDEPDDVGGTARALQDVAKRHLGASGLEREAAALLLSRLYMRKDTGLGFHEFVESSHTFIQESTSVFEAIGRLSVLCEVVKSGSVEQVEREQAQLLAIASAIPQSKQLSNNIVVRKLRTKLISRIGLRLLPTGSAGKGNLRRARGLIASETETNEIVEDDIDVPTEVEDILQSLFENLQDKDTIVRWSAAKGVARVAERLPKDFCGQVLETVLGLFEVHWIAGASLYDLSAVAEGTWHGACLACAEMARRSLVEPEYLPQLIEWMSKALYFDLRKGAHSIGSNVRDAAAYVLWALARTQNQGALVPHATYLAQRLIAVALFDREIHIRRAASAAFQEHVGRNSLFPHGIDVLAKTDFYSVSIRKNAFLVAAPSVAVHPEYRNFLLDHVLDVVLRHWDIAMRELGAESLRLICAIDLNDLAPRAIKKIVPLMESVDLADVHGGLQALTEIAIAYKQGVDNVHEREKNLQNVFSHLKYVPEKTLTTTRNELVASAACRLIANSITLTEINLGERSSVPNWRKIIDIGLKHRMTTVQEAAADAMAAASNLTDVSADITRLIKELRRGSPVMQQSLAMVLGVINYNNHPKAVAKALDYLLDCLKPKTTANIETRRSCLQAIPRIILTVSSDLPTYISPEMMNTLTDTLLAGLEDYTIDERGDVGSWARIACIQGLTTICELLFRISGTIPDFGSYLPPHKYRAVAAGLLKQGAERLDNVRQTAGASILTLLKAPLPAVEADASGRWRMPAAALLEELFLSEADQSEWNDGTWLFPRVMRLLEVPEYRQPVLSGIVISIGSKTDSTRKPVASSMVSYAQALPLTDNTENTYSLVALVGDLINHAKSNMTTNAVVVPVIQTFTLLLEADALRQLTADPVGLKHLDALLAMCSRNVSKLKSTQRIHESMKVVTNLLTFEETRTKSIDLLPEFLAHAFPKVRTDTAEYLYVLTQSSDLGFEADEVEDLLLETEWANIDVDAAKEIAAQIVDSIKASLA